MPFPGVKARRAVVALLAAGMLTASWMWFRDSSFVRVQDVFITGLESGDAAKIRSALRSAALDMSTLHVREDALRASVAAYPSVAGMSVDADFPRRLTIEVVEHKPVALVEMDGRRIPAVASGLLLRGVRAAESGLPRVKVRRSTGSGRLTDPHAVASLRVLAAAPAPLVPRLLRTRSGRRGLVVEMREGPDLIFGTAARAPAKWAAAARVLADQTAAGAVYLDVRVPERVAAGGVAPASAEEPSTSSRE